MPQSIRTSTSASAVVFAPLDGSGRAELVERRLTDAIVLGLLADGERLPSESDMAKRLGVATVTAREALESLRLKGLVETRRGRDGGSFVTAGRDRTRAVLDAGSARSRASSFATWGPTIPRSRAAAPSWPPTEPPTTTSSGSAESRS
ncbi:MAG: winged helix-turn-helix domain-containing protein [Schumannella sp.]